MAVWDGNSSNIHSVASHSADGDELRLAYQRNNLVGCLRRWHQGDAPGESWGLIASLTCPCDVIVNTDDETYHEGLMLSFNIMEEEGAYKAVNVRKLETPEMLENAHRELEECHDVELLLNKGYEVAELNRSPGSVQGPGQQTPAGRSDGSSAMFQQVPPNQQMPMQPQQLQQLAQMPQQGAQRPLQAFQANQQQMHAQLQQQAAQQQQQQQMAHMLQQPLPPHAVQLQHQVASQPQLAHQCACAGAAPAVMPYAQTQGQPQPAYFDPATGAPASSYTAPGQAALLTTGTQPQQPQQKPSIKLLLEPPPMLSASPSDCAVALQTGHWQGTRATTSPRTMESNGTAVPAQLGTEYADSLLQVYQSYAAHDWTEAFVTPQAQDQQAWRAEMWWQQQSAQENVHQQNDFGGGCVPLSTGPVQPHHMGGDFTPQAQGVGNVAMRAVQMN